MSNLDIRDALEFELHRLSSAPRIVPKLAVLVRDPNMNPEDVIELIRHDPALTARLLAACKSAAFHRSIEVTSVQDAVQRMGFAEVYRMAVIAAFRSGFHGPFHAYEEQAEAVWERAVVTSVLMEEFSIAEESDHGVAFTMGLLHMIGMFFIDAQCAKTAGLRIHKGYVEDQIDEETKAYGLPHMEVSALALDYWGFSADIYQPIRWYHNPSEAREYSHHAQMLGASVEIARQMLNGSDEREILKMLASCPVMINETPGEFLDRIKARIEAVKAFITG